MSSNTIASTVTKSSTVQTSGTRGKLNEHKLKQEILSYSSTAHRYALRRAESDFRSFVASLLHPIIIWMTGSFAAGVDMFKADLDFTLKIPVWDSESDKNKKMGHLKNVFAQCDLFEEVYLIRGNTPVIQMVHKSTGTGIDVTIDGEDAKRNTQLLSLYAQADSRFPKLCKAVKGWASEAGIEGAKRHRLNSFSVCMMLIQFLQGVGVLPNLQSLFPEMNGEFEVPNDNYKRKGFKRELRKRGHKFSKDSGDLVSLYLGFLEYYATFDFATQWISIRKGAPQTKEFDLEGLPLNGLPQRNKYIVVADPFHRENPRNCAVSVPSQKFVDRVQRGFRTALESIHQKGTLFTHYPSAWRRMLEKEGKSGDLRIVAWRDESLEVRVAWSAHIPWGSGTGIENGQRPWYPRKPSDFWELDRKPAFEYQEFEDWPEPPVMMFF